MIITLTGKELAQAVAQYLGNTYTMDSLKFTVGRGGRDTRAEAEVSLTATTPEKDEPSPDRPNLFIHAGED